MKGKIAILAILAFGCIGKNTDSKTAYGTESIVMFNASDEGKASIARMLDRINRCAPKVVGINFLFENNLQKTDTILSNSINGLQDVVLASIYQDETFFRSDTIYRQGTAIEGLVELGVDEDEVVTKQMIFVSIADEVKWSFPMTVASIYDADKSLATMHSVETNKYYEINFESESDFAILEANDSTWDCSAIKDKIVLIGFLGPGSKDAYLIPGREKKYATLILAHCIRDILNGHFTRVD